MESDRIEAGACGGPGGIEQTLGPVDETDGDAGNRPGPADLERPAMPIAYDGRKPII
jgi:hypothetical protein